LDVLDAREKPLDVFGEGLRAQILAFAPTFFEGLAQVCQGRRYAAEFVGDFSNLFPFLASRLLQRDVHPHDRDN
jgi:hypothetical protein